MKSTVLVLLFLSSIVHAQGLKIPEYDWTLTDVLSKGLNKETLYSEMDREFVKVKTSICSNRAHMWANDFKTQHNLDTGKIFLFFTKSESTSIRLRRTWWYHVAPVINEGGKMWVMDPAFGGKSNSPLELNDWFYSSSSFRKCHEIQSHETELVELMFSRRTFPKETSYGRNDCYYKVVPHTIWTPRVLVENLLGVDQSGRPVRVERPEIVKSELFQACVEATTGKVGWALGNSRNACTEYVGN